jgi:hypothetical protein
LNSNQIKPPPGTGIAFTRIKYTLFPFSTECHRATPAKSPLSNVTVAQTAKLPLFNEVTEQQGLQYFCHFSTAPNREDYNEK